MHIDTLPLQGLIYDLMSTDAYIHVYKHVHLHFLQCKAQCWAVCPVTCACTCPYTCLYACKKMWIYAYAHGYANFDVSIEFHMCLHRGFVHTSVYMPMEISIQISKWIFIRVCVQKVLRISAKFSFSCLRNMLEPDCMFIHMYNTRIYAHVHTHVDMHV